MSAIDKQIQGFARQIRARRRELGLTQVELAELAGVSTRFVHEVENAKPTVQLAKLIDVAGALGVELVLRTRRADAV